MAKEFPGKLEASRKELLDLGLRNPLISHSQRAKQVKVVDEITSEIYRMLVLENRAMSFEAVSYEDLGAYSEKAIPPHTAGQKKLLTQPNEDPDDYQFAARHIDRKLQTNLSSEKLQAKLLSIHNDARSYLEEQGVNILFLVLGFVHWYESDASNEARRAPLLSSVRLK